ncbi:phosphate transporter [Hysterangium stoloniferum]|nr:phosphate transporter [Hysterangium stoloniferum]
MSRSHGSDELNPQMANNAGNNVVYSLSHQRAHSLATIDKAPFSFFHVKVWLAVGIGFFTDAYDLFAIDIASVMLGNLYGHAGASCAIASNPIGRCLTPTQDLGLKIASPVGTLIGQVLFGWFADVVGRKRMYGIELCIIIAATFLQAIAGQGHAVSIISVLIFCHFLMGIGIGGDCPLSAVITFEFAAIKTRERLMTAVFSMQGWGQFTAAVVSTVVVAAFKKQIQNDPPLDPVHVDFIWRLTIGLGCVPATIALYARLTIATPRFTMDIEMNVQRAAQDISTSLTPGIFTFDPESIVHRKTIQPSRRDFMTYFGPWKHAKVLVGTANSWFAIDVAFYGLGLNSSKILSIINFGGPSTLHPDGKAIYESLSNISLGYIILSVAGLFPGYYATYSFIDSWGRKPIQLMGFVMLTILFLIMGFGYKAILSHSTSAFVFLYCLANFFQNFGPNTTTFITPGGLFPTRYRSTAYGISAATGKLGAIIAQIAFTWTGRADLILQVFGFITLSGIISTLLIPETKRQSLEDISGEGREYVIVGSDPDLFQFILSWTLESL